MIDTSQVSAVIVTRGDVDLAPVLGPLPFDDIVVWDNQARPVDLHVFGRYAALAEARHDVVYFQDDDVLFDAFEELLGAYQPGWLVANMDAPWVEKGNYFDTVCVGAGAIADRRILLRALARYQERYPADPWLHLECDLIVGTLVPTQKIDLGYRVRTDVEQDGRLCRQPWQSDQKERAMARAALVRDLGERERRLPIDGALTESRRHEVEQFVRADAA